MYKSFKYIHNFKELGIVWCLINIIDERQIMTKNNELINTFYNEQFKVNKLKDVKLMKIFI